MTDPLGRTLSDIAEWKCAAAFQRLDQDFRREGHEWYDHRIDLYWQWMATHNPMWLERGVMSAMKLRGGHTLDLCCGDGFFAANFYSIRSRDVVGLDIDMYAIDHAWKYNDAPNVTYSMMDIRAGLPGAEHYYSNVIWDGAIEHFSCEEIQNILKDIKLHLASDGILTGMTVIEPEATPGGMFHVTRFKDLDDLRATLAPLGEVTLFETKYSTRHNAYFWVSPK